jgi:hypothetical protein
MSPRMNHPTSGGRPSKAPRRAFALAVVLWTIAMASLVLLAIQTTAWRQAADGREVLGRVRAYWAARAGVEAQIARLQAETQLARPLSTPALLKALADVSTGSLEGPTYEVFSGQGGRAVPGPADAHARLNINTLRRNDLLLLPSMTDDMASAILDWIDADDIPQSAMGGSGGAESETYLGLTYSYRPRNAPIRTIAELVLVKDVPPELVRGVDYELTGIATPANANYNVSGYVTSLTGELDAGWSALLTASSAGGGLSPTNEPRLDLTTASAGDVAALLRVTSQQAQALVDIARTGQAAMEDFIRQDLTQLNAAAQQILNPPQPGQRPRGIAQIPPLTREQLALLYDACSIGDPIATGVGKLNINTAPGEMFEFLAGVTPELREALIAYRDGRGGEVSSIIDLLEVPGITRGRLATLARQLGTRSDVFEFIARGRDPGTGIEVEMHVELERTTLPVTIRSMIVR